MLPGIVFESTRERKLPGFEHSAFREASRIPLSSVILTGFSLTVLSAVRAASPGLMPSAGQWLRSPRPYLVEHYRLIARTLVLEVGLASGLALIAAHALLPRSWHGTEARPHNTFSVVLHDAATDRGGWSLRRRATSAPFVQLQTAKGTLFSGIITAYDPSGPRDDRHIALRPPLAVQRPGDECAHPIPAAWQRVVLPLADVSEMHIAFVREGQQEKSKGRFGRRRRPVSR